MRSQFTVGALALVLAVGLGSVALTAEQEKRGKDFDLEAMEKAWADFAKLAPEHKHFKDVVGEWNVETKETWPGMQKPIVSRGKATFRLMLGGRFLQQRYEPEHEGQKFRGFGIHGYDKAKKKYVSVWLDNMSTGIMVSEGEYDEEADQLVQVGESESPLGKMRLRTVMKAIDDNGFTMSFYVAMPDKKEHKGMVITYTRKK